MTYSVNNKERKRWQVVGYTALLMLICVGSFLIAKYIVRNSIGNEETPIDTSTRI